MRRNQNLLDLGFKFNVGDDSYTMNLSDHFYLEIQNGKLYILANEEESLTGIVYTELTEEMIEKVNATNQVIKEV